MHGGGKWSGMTSPAFSAWDVGGWVETHDDTSSGVGDWERET